MARIAVVSPYAWSPPGGVTRHVEALAAELRARGEEVLVVAPGGGDVALAGRPVGIRTNGAVSRLVFAPSAVVGARAALAAWRPDVVHLHEPVAPAVCWDLLGLRGPALVGTFHCHSTALAPHVLARAAGAARRLRRLHVRIAVSEAAAWTGRRFYGGRYRVVPNGVEVPAVAPRADVPPPAAAVLPAASARPLRVAFVGQAVPRKGLPVLLRAFEALREDVDARLVVVGAEPAQVAPLLLDPRGVDVLGRVDDAVRARAVAGADVLVAPALGGESFGMVLAEALAVGTPVVASAIPGYADVVRHGREGLLVPPGDAGALTAALRGLAAAPAAEHARLREAARARAEAFAWPRVADAVQEAYADARALAARPLPAGRRAAIAAGLRPADPEGAARPRRLPPPVVVAPGAAPAPAAAPPSAARRRRDRHAPRHRLAFALGLGAAAAGGALALHHVGAASLGAAVLGTTPAWALAAFAVMALSMAFRASAWHAVLRAAGVPGVTRRDALSATAVGVLASAALPARLGEPARAVLVARRTGRPRAHLPAIAGTLVAQTLLNVLALAVLAVLALPSLELLATDRPQLVLAVLAPVALVLAVLGASAVPRLRAARAGLRLTPPAVVLQLAAWALQWLGCWLLLVALGLGGAAGPAAAAAVLLAVNVTALVPATPGNLGVFQAACVAVLAGAHGVPAADALAYGLLLQALELGVAVAMGVPAFLREGLTWREVRLRALAVSPA